MATKYVFTHYTQGEGKDWIPFDCRMLVSEDELDISVTRGTYTFIRGRMVHALKSEFGHEWDCVNGWRLGDNCVRF